MPCDQVNTMSVEIKAADRELLETALKRLGLSYQRRGEQVIVYSAQGTITITGDNALLAESAQSTLNQIKDQYARVVVEEAATLYNWNLTMDEEAQGQLILRKYD